MLNKKQEGGIRAELAAADANPIYPYMEVMYAMVVVSESMAQEGASRKR